MHRQSTPRTGDQDAQRETQAQPRANATASQQSVLNLQQGVGNSLTGQIVQRSGAVIRRAGDKLAFERGKGLKDDEGLAEQVAQVIEAHRKRKRDKKDDLESEKEDRIGIRDDASKKYKLKLAMDPMPEVIKKFVGGQDEASTIKAHKETLANYHDRVQGESGWRWEALSAELGDVQGINFDRKPTDGVVDIVASGSGKKIYSIHFGQNRFAKEADQDREDGRKNVFTKRGYAQGTKPKEFVADNNDVKTRRFVTRAVTIWHLAAMFGLDFKNADMKTGLTDVEPAYEDETKQKRLDAQMPRYTGDAFDTHGDTFNLAEAAGYIPDRVIDKEPSTEFTRNHVLMPPGKGKGLKPMDRGTRTNFMFTSGYNGARQKTDPMGLNEKASMQVRNGSGPGQPFLSTASVQIDPKRKPKLIRANKGERFDNGAENQATVKVDLAAAQDLGVKIVNQHDDESHQHKISWDRVYDKADLKELSERFKIAEDYSEFADLVRPTAKELQIFTEEERELIRTQQWQQVVNDKYTKRSAPEELDEYIYSARKNREVLMDKIPIGCVSEIRLNNEKGKWPNLNGIMIGEWVPFDQGAQNALKLYLRGTLEDDVQQEDHTNIKEMFRIAAAQKKEEGGNRT